MYKITIEKIDRVKVTKQEYEKIADTGNKTDGKAIYGYVPYETEENQSKTILLQTADELDIAAVIKAINNL